MTNILFVCIGNSCRSQMAEGFARKYGSDVSNVWSAGLAPAAIVQPMTIEVMRRKNIDIREQFSKSVDELELDAFNVVVNMSGLPMPTPVQGDLYRWDVADPMTQSLEVYIRVRDQIETLVMQLILELRRSLKSAPAKPVTKPVSAPVRKTISALPGTVKPDAVTDPRSAGNSSRQFGFGRVRKSRD